ncbi:hypothetical protein M2M59_11505 [Rummeliibacillus sp. G93]|uniref:hypothetical protein n=1 Tax=Rummeliibacillus sp. G93 TaxID=2939494 RepID=UPI00201C2B7A|nr:hypothetical protein [Rummeliibacillus sp. G93]UQW96589.1 hypothetical protein M2M59_11505 [Rummeliibacillus sp. G93]
MKNGIEKASKWMIPILFMFFIVLAVRSITLDGAFEGIKFMFVPDWSYHTGKKHFCWRWDKPSLSVLYCLASCFSTNSF